MRSTLVSLATTLVIASSAGAQSLGDFNSTLQSGIQLWREINRGAEQDQRQRQEPVVNPRGRQPVPSPPNYETRPTPPSAPLAEPTAPRLPRPVVAEIQQRLQDLGYDPGPVDGLEGPKTRAALRQWELSQGLPPNGELTRERLVELREAAGGYGGGFAGGLSPSGGGAPRTSFDCALATRPDEMAICASPELAAKDLELDAIFNKALAAAGPARNQQVVEEQRAWLAARRSCNSNAACLGAMMDGRIAALESLAPQRRQDPLAGLADGGTSSGMGFADGFEPARQPSYADLVHLALLADPAAFAAEREVAGVAYRLAVTDEETCRQMAPLMADLSRDVFRAREFVIESAARFDQVLASIGHTPGSLEMRVENQLRLGTYDFQAGAYQMPGIPLVSGGPHALWDNPTAPPCETGLALHHALPNDGMRIARMGLGKLSVELEGAPGTRLLPLGPDDAQAFEARNPGKSVKLVAQLRLEPPAIAFAPLGGRILSLTAIDGVTGQRLYDFPIAGSGTPGGALAAGYQPTYRDFVHMALMSDRDAYLQQIEVTGLEYFAVTADDKTCQRARQRLQKGGEFAAREIKDELSAEFREVVQALDQQPRRFEIPIEAEYQLGTYDFVREGFPVEWSPHQTTTTPIVQAGEVVLPGESGAALCRLVLSDLGRRPGFGGTDDSVAFTNLTARHDGASGASFLPMPPDRARAFREAGKQSITVKALLIVEPRPQGRGALSGRIAAVAAHDPKTDELLYRFEMKPNETVATKAPTDGTAWHPELAAALLAPAVAETYEASAFYGNAVRYFEMNRQNVDAYGNPPPGAPLPLEDIRGVSPELIVARNTEQLRKAFANSDVATPLTVVVEEPHTARFDPDTGVNVENFVGHQWTYDEKIQLSDRDLPLYDTMPFVRDLRGGKEESFRLSMLTAQHFRPALELDRILRVPMIDLSLEEAVARGMVGHSTGYVDVIARWTLEITEVRMMEDRPVISARILGLAFDWEDGAPLAEVDVALLPTVAGLRAAEAATAPKPASAEGVVAPASGMMFDAEAADLFQLRLLPETVDDRILERMMISRFAYEEQAARQDGQPTWGRFFLDVSTEPDAAERARRLAEFRAWSEARAAALPEVVTIRVDLHPSGEVAPFEAWGSGPHDNGCSSTRRKAERGETPTEREAMELRLCDFLDAAWAAPEPILFLTDFSQREGAPRGEGRGPRYACGGDPYCRTIRDARIELGLQTTQDMIFPLDLVKLDRIPMPNAEMRGSDRDIDLEIDVSITGASMPDGWPESFWAAARRQARPFAERYGLGGLAHRPESDVAGQPVLFEATVRAARMVDQKTGETVFEPELVSPARLPMELLEIEASRVAGLDILGVRLGMSFAEAERIVRDHMNVGRVLVADRKRQLGLVSGEVRPYSSGRMFVSADETEIITIFDEPPAMPETVLGIWRMMRLPRGSIDPVALRAQVAGRYGEPNLVEEVSPMGGKGLAFVWSDFAPEQRCGSISQTDHEDLWRDEDSGDVWVPPFLGRAYLPDLGTHVRLSMMGNGELEIANLCPPILGVRFASFGNGDTATGEEVLTWLHDAQKYGRVFFESRNAPQELEPSGEEASIKIKF